MILSALWEREDSATCSACGYTHAITGRYALGGGGISMCCIAAVTFTRRYLHRTDPTWAGRLVLHGATRQIKPETATRKDTGSQ